LLVQSNSKLGTVQFRQIPLDSNEAAVARKRQNAYDSGRPSYISADQSGRPLYLFHRMSLESGQGKWYIGNELLSDEGAIGYIHSWAVLPYYFESSQDLPTSTNWYFINDEGEGFTADPNFSILCFAEQDKTVFLQMDVTISPRIDGYYVERILQSSTPENKKSVWAQIKMKPTTDKQLYLFNLNADQRSKWLIGFEYGVDSAFAFSDDPAESAVSITNPFFVIEQYEWRAEPSIQVLSTSKYLELADLNSLNVKQTLPDLLKYFRNSLIKEQQESYNRVYELRNNVFMPKIGLGTGGLYLEESESVFHAAIDMGYRLFDLAREYQNEKIIGKVINALQSSFTRNQFFLETKVWPTQLGFLPTTNAILDSLNEIQTSYVDLYLLHWPECDRTIEWMHCQDTQDPKGTWRESWFALEKAYSEGRILSLGFSNANMAILKELSEIATVLPHVIQNWSDLTNLDLPVREWCDSHETIYQPYASIRNLKFQSNQIRAKTQLMARRYNVTEYDVNLKFFLQSGASIIPRASQKDKLKNKIDNPDEWSLIKM
jgi:diketogulonate reductase-like aldo/keto reductase